MRRRRRPDLRRAAERCQVAHHHLLGRSYQPETERQVAIGDWLDWYNLHRPHTEIRGRVPADRVTHLSEPHI